MRTITDTELAGMDPDELLAAYRTALDERRNEDVTAIRKAAIALMGAHDWLQMVVSDK